MREQIVVAYGNNGEIGKDNGLLWHMPAELKHFRDVTMGGSLVMGRNTWESIGRPLPGRESIVVTSGEIDHPEVKVARSLPEALGMASRELVSIIGGAQIYAEAVTMPQVREIQATWVHADFPDADTFFPNIEGQGWYPATIECHEADDKNAYDYEYITLIRE